MTNHLEEVEKLIDHLRRVISNLVEEDAMNFHSLGEVGYDDIAYTISYARKHLKKAKRQLEELGERKKERNDTRGT